MTKCQCPAAGFCERHKVAKTAHWHKLCQTRQNYFQAWEDGHGPGQTQDPQKTKEAQRRKRMEKKLEQSRLISWVKWLRKPEDTGVGDTVERLLAKVGGRQIKQLIEGLVGSCGCTNRQKWLNRKFPY